MTHLLQTVASKASPKGRIGHTLRNAEMESLRRREAPITARIALPILPPWRADLVATHLNPFPGSCGGSKDSFAWTRVIAGSDARPVAVLSKPDQGDARRESIRHVPPRLSVPFWL